MLKFLTNVLVGSSFSRLKGEEPLDEETTKKFRQFIAVAQPIPAGKKTEESAPSSGKNEPEDEGH